MLSPIGVDVFKERVEFAAKVKFEENVEFEEVELEGKGVGTIDAVGAAELFFEETLAVWSISNGSYQY